MFYFATLRTTSESMVLNSPDKRLRPPQILFQIFSFLGVYISIYIQSDVYDLDEILVWLLNGVTQSIRTITIILMDIKPSTINIFEFTRKLLGVDWYADYFC